MSQVEDLNGSKRVGPKCHKTEQMNTPEKLKEWVRCSHVVKKVNLLTKQFLARRVTSLRIYIYSD